MTFSFWLQRFLTVFTGVGVVLLAVYLARGRPLAPAAGEAAGWAGAATVIFIATRVYRSRRGQHCELCGDTPQLRPGETCDRTK